MRTRDEFHTIDYPEKFGIDPDIIHEISIDVIDKFLITINERREKHKWSHSQYINYAYQIMQTLCIYVLSKTTEECETSIPEMMHVFIESLQSIAKKAGVN